jgi:hypothetical protein
VSIDVALPSDPPEPSGVEVDIEFDAAKSEAKADIAKPQSSESVSNQFADSEVVMPFGSFAPKRPSINRRVLLVGGLGVAALIGILAFAFGKHAPAPVRRGVAANTSATVAEAPVKAANSGNAPSASVSAAAAQPAPPVSAAATAQPEPSAAPVVEEEDVKIPINIKPDGAVMLYKGRIVGRTPFILKQPRGEKRSYEVGKPGYATRRVYVTGNERTIGFELGLDVPHPDSL